ncbi:putative nucleotidyltransferase substrate binding domain-containing protein [Hydrogenophaga sp.]|uniref:putative nucleotidyltransferase substrate binding domain-containing protein n=1 Tax=Hydrogenophaga sp. TaxID=1904254 RepID=UPI003567129E
MSSPVPHPLTLLDRLQQHRVFGLLGSDALAALAGSLYVQPIGAGDIFAAKGLLHEQLHWLLSGTLELLDANEEVLLTLLPGELFGHGQGPALAVRVARARTDCSVVSFETRLLEDWRQQVPALAYFLPLEAEQHGLGLPGHTPSPGESGDPALNLMTTPVRALIKRTPFTLPPLTSIRDAAARMREERVSSVLIVEQGHLFGLVTDRDLRNRAVAADLDTQRPIMDIATLAPMTIELNSPAFDALLLMARHNIHHVPVVEGDQVRGMITATDLTEQHSTSAVYLAGDIHKQTGLDGLQRASRQIKRLQQNLAAAKASAYSTGHILTAITDALTARLLQLGEAQLGPAPVDYVWVAAGSQARNEQTAKSDQDNCMVIDDSYDEVRHGAYFKALSQFVCDGLDACGYIYCPGEMMAMTDTWRQPRSRWAEYFSRWTGQPDPKSLMLTCVFFDLRAVHGKSELLEDLRQGVLQRTQGNSIFLAYMVGNALTHQPPLGMFKGLSTIRSGEHKGKIDLKHTGIVPIVDLARVYALAGGDAAVNTHERLLSAAGGAISEQGARDLRDALEFLAFVRIQHQARQMAQGVPADNFLNPDDISNFERTQLKDAFTVVQSLQSVLSQRYSF